MDLPISNLTGLVDDGLLEQPARMNTGRGEAEAMTSIHRDIVGRLITAKPGSEVTRRVLNAHLRGTISPIGFHYGSPPQWLLDADGTVTRVSNLCGTNRKAGHKGDLAGVASRADGHHVGFGDATRKRIIRKLAKR